MKETSVELAESSEYITKVVGTLDSAIQETREIAQEARSEGLFSTALNGMKILAGILETQAKIMGIADKHTSKAHKTLHVHMELPKEEVKKLAEDFHTTVDIGLVDTDG